MEISIRGGVLNAVGAFESIIASLFNHLPADDTSEICYILNLPSEILQIITKFLQISDILSLSRTCHRFHSLIHNDHFWMHLIRAQFPRWVAQFYVFDLFEKSESIQTNDKLLPSDFEHNQTEDELDEMNKQHHAKMFVSKEDFVKRVQYYQYRKPQNNLQVPFMKLIYLYLIDRKCTAAIDMDTIHHSADYLVEQSDSDSFKSRILHLQTTCCYEINGRFQHEIMPGRYEVIWRMKCHGIVRVWADTKFSVVPSHGNILVYRISEKDFQCDALTNANQWFLVKMGHIIIDKPSEVRIGICNYINGFWKSGFSCDYIELKLIL